MVSSSHLDGRDPAAEEPSHEMDGSLITDQPWQTLSDDDGSVVEGEAEGPAGPETEFEGLTYHLHVQVEAESGTVTVTAYDQGGDGSVRTVLEREAVEAAGLQVGGGEEEWLQLRDAVVQGVCIRRDENGRLAMAVELPARPVVQEGGEEVVEAFAAGGEVVEGSRSLMVLLNSQPVALAILVCFVAVIAALLLPGFKKGRPQQVLPPPPGNDSVAEGRSGFGLKGTVTFDGVALGIDLGTTNTVMVTHPDLLHRVGDEASGRQAVEVVLNKEGDALTPSVVHFPPGGVVPLVGSAALMHLVKSPATTACLAKRLVGRTFTDPEVAKVSSAIHFPLVACPASIPIHFDGITRHVTGFGGRVCISGSGLPSPVPVEMVSAMVLHKMRVDAAAKFKRNVSEVRHAVVTVPAWFEEKQKEATVLAAHMAGIELLRLVPEPTAAALSYFYKHDPNGLQGPFRLVVVDFGGGTFDVSVLHYDSGKFTVKGVGGDLHLGGEDLDHALASHLMAKAFKPSTKVKPSARVTAEFRAEAEKAKKHLSVDTQAAVYLPGVLPGGRDVDMAVTRDEFEELARPFVQRAIECIQRTLNDSQSAADLGPSDKVLLVGGSSRIPLFRNEVEQLFKPWGVQVLAGALDEDLAVAQGAALLAYRAAEPELFGRLFPSFGMTDVTTRTIGVAVCNDLSCDQLVSDPVIRRFSPLPAKGEGLWSTVVDYQRSVLIQVLEGEARAADKNREVARVEISKIQKAKAGVPEIVAEISVNETTGVLHVTAYDMAFQGHKQELDVAYYNGVRLSEGQLQVAREVATQLATKGWKK